MCLVRAFARNSLLEPTKFWRTFKARNSEVAVCAQQPNFSREDVVLCNAQCALKETMEFRPSDQASRISTSSFLDPPDFPPSIRPFDSARIVPASMSKASSSATLCALSGTRRRPRLLAESPLATGRIADCERYDRMSCCHLAIQKVLLVFPMNDVY